MALPSFILRTVTPGGALDKFLPDVHTLTVSPIFSTVGSITFDYPENGVNFGLLDNDVELAIVLDGVEVPELRCVIESYQGDDANEAGDGTLWTYTCHTMLGSLAQAVVYPPLWPLADPIKHIYTAANPGKIISDFIGFAQARGTLGWLTYDFSATLDSAGNAWAGTIDMEFNVGLKYTQVVQDLVDTGLVEVRMNGRVLQAFNSDHIGSDKSTGANPVIFVMGRDMQESDRKSSTRDLSTVVLLGGEASIFAERSADSGTLTTYGRRESYVSLQHVQTVGALDVIGDQLISLSDRPLLEVTHKLNFDNPGNPQPIRDFDLGDWVLSDVGRGLERHRIAQWVISVQDGSGSGGTVTGSVILNDLIADQLGKVHRRLTNLENGTSAAGVSVDVDDGRSPAAPTSVALTSSYYIDFQQARSVVGVSWAAVTTNSDSTAASNIKGYAARWRYSTDSTTLWRDTRLLDASSLNTTFDNIATGVTVVVEVAAFNTWGRYGAWSADVTIVSAHDTVPPAKPSIPVVTSNVGTLRVSWDGLDFAGLAMAPDFIGVEVHIGPNGTFTPGPSTLKDFLPGSAAQSTTITAGLSYGTDYFARLVAVDNSANKSSPSDSNSTSHAILTQVVTTEIGTGQVGLANTAFSDVGNLIDDGSFEQLAFRNSRAALFSGSHFAWDNTTSSNGTWSLRHDSWAGGATSEQLMLQGALPVKPGERVFGAADYRATTSTPGSSYLDLSVRWLDKSGNTLDNTGTITSPNTFYELSNQNWNAVDNTWKARVAGLSKVAPPNVVTMEIWLFTINRTAGTIWIDAVEVRRQIDTLLVADAAITNAKIGLLAVNDANIATLNVGKLVAGTLSVDITVSSRIKTANTGARVELNSGGIGTWDSSGTQTVAIGAGDGSVNIIGTLRSGPTGRRIEINPFATGLPEIRFFPTTGSNYGFLNATASGDGTKAYTGLNMGQFTANGTTVSFRNYLTDVSAALEMIRTDTQAQWGGGIYVYANGVSATYTGTTRSAYMDIRDTYTSIGFDDASDANDSFTTWDNTGLISTTGHYAGYVGASHNQAIFGGYINMGGGSYGTVAVSYAATMLSTMIPIPNLYDTGSTRGMNITALSSTGFSIGMTSVTSGNPLFWVFRVP
jgi:hypothetical protein